MVSLPRALRADAIRNREIIIDAAASAFATSGLEASVQEILLAAKVGAGTLYRHFPTREDLVEAVLEEKMTRYAEAAERAVALAADDPWGAFSAYVYFVFELQATDPAFADALTAPITGSHAFRSQHVRALRASVSLAKILVDSGELNPEFHHSDLYLMQVANGAIAAASRVDAPDAWRRFAAYALEALRSHDRPLPPVPEAWVAQLARVMDGHERHRAS